MEPERNNRAPLKNVSVFYMEWKTLELMTKRDFAPIVTLANMEVVRINAKMSKWAILALYLWVEAQLLKPVRTSGWIVTWPGTTSHRTTYIYCAYSLQSILPHILSFVLCNNPEIFVGQIHSAKVKMREFKGLRHGHIHSLW